MIEPRAKEIIQEAKEWVGTPYQHQASLKGIGCDCLGLVRGIASDLGYLPPNLNKTDPETIGYGNQPYGKLVPLFVKYCQEIPLNALSEGHILIFKIKREPQHCAIFIGNNTIIHALITVPCVVEHEMDIDWLSKITNVFRFPDDTRITSI